MVREFPLFSSLSSATSPLEKLCMEAFGDLCIRLCDSSCSPVHIYQVNVSSGEFLCSTKCSSISTHPVLYKNSPLLTSDFNTQYCPHYYITLMSVMDNLVLPLAWVSDLYEGAVTLSLWYS